jgi:hypothetical protein
MTDAMRVKDSAFGRFAAFLRVMRRRKRPIESLRLLKQRPALMLAQNVFETALVISGRMSIRYKVLGQIKTSALVGCPF